MIHYIDTSAYLKLIIEEPESGAMSAAIETARGEGHRVVSSILLETELRRAGHRYGIDTTIIDHELAKLAIISAADSTFVRAGAFVDPTLRSLDALHVAAAVECGATTIYTYDSRQASAAQRVGIIVAAPGR